MNSRRLHQCDCQVMPESDFRFDFDPGQTFCSSEWNYLHVKHEYMIEIPLNQISLRRPIAGALTRRPPEGAMLRRHIDASPA